MEFTKALAKTFEGSEFVEIWHFSEVYQTLL